jgi:hypothetical protein
MIRKRHSHIPISNLGEICSLCKAFIHPRDMVRLDWEYCRCPHCGGGLRDLTLPAIHPGRRADKAAEQERTRGLLNRTRGLK